jgi:aspartokinase-like uncharacterized kinase
VSGTTRVVKVGGSLFDLPDLGKRIETWLTTEPSARTIFIAGGGSLVDVIREWQVLQKLSEEHCHWLAISAMSLSAELLHRVLPSLKLCRHPSDCVRRDSPSILDVRLFMEQDALGPGRLAQSFCATSDSIAAAIARHLEADELVLLKSTLPTTNEITDWTNTGFVDADFAQHARDLPRVLCVNLRSAPTGTSATLGITNNSRSII